MDVGYGCLPGEKNQETTKTELALGAEISLEAVLRAVGIIEKMMRGEIRAPHRGLVIKKK